jgi:TPR repeat protein
MAQAFKGQVATDIDLVVIALCVEQAAKEMGNFELAKKCLEFTCNLGSEKGMREFVILISENPHAAPEDCQQALAYLEKSAKLGSIDSKRLMAQIYWRDSKFGCAQYAVKADIYKAYFFVIELLNACPDDVEGHYILGHILENYGGRYGIPAGQFAYAYELLSSAVATCSQIAPSDCACLGSLCFELGKFDQAIKWFGKAGDFPYSLWLCGINMLIEAVKGNPLFDKNIALDFIERSLSKARKFILSGHPGFCSVFEHELLLDILLQDAAKNDLRARTILARISYLLADKDMGISKDEALKYLIDAAEKGYASAQSFLGFIYSHGIMVPHVEQVACNYLSMVLQKQELPNFVLEELADELYFIGKEPGYSTFHMQAAYKAIAALLRVPTDNNIGFAFKLADEAERALIKNFEKNKLLAADIYTSGAWDALRSEAENNMYFAALLGSALCRRYVLNITNWRTVQEEGIPLIEKALRAQVSWLKPAEIATLFAKCIEHAIRIGEKDVQSLQELGARALQLDPHNAEILICAATISSLLYSDEKYQSQLVQKSLSDLEVLAKAGNASAALQLGVRFLKYQGSDSPLATFKKGIDYLKISAKQGNQYAVCTMVAACFKEAGQFGKYAKTCAVECLNFLICKRDLPETMQLYYNGFKFMINGQLRQAINYFDRFSQKTDDPTALVRIANSLLPFKEGQIRGCQLLVQAVEISGKKQMKFDGTDMKSMMQQIVGGLEKDPDVAMYMILLKDALKRCNYVL